MSIVTLEYDQMPNQKAAGPFFSFVSIGAIFKIKRYIFSILAIKLSGLRL